MQEGTPKRESPFMPAAAPRRDSEPTIRRGGPADLDAVHRIENRSFDRDRFPRRNLARVLASKAAAFLLVEADGVVAGYVMVLFRKGSSVARLYSIAVDPDFRGQGLAERLIAAAAIAATARGADRLRLELRPSNTGAQRLYRRAGFHHLESKPGYYNDGEDAIRMELALAGIDGLKERPHMNSGEKR